MALPIINVPKYEITVPSTGKKIKVRPFLIKEQKILLIAQESEDLDVMINSIKEIITSCTDGAVDVETLAMFDLEYIILQIRAKSVGEVVELLFKCEDCVDNEKAVVQINIDLTTIQIEHNPEHNKKILLFNDVGVVMKYPSFSLFKKLDETTENDYIGYINLIQECIELVYDSDDVYPFKDQSAESIESFIGDLTTEQFDKIKKFFDTTPKLRKEVEYKCPVCNKEHKKTLEGIKSFF